nr:death-associated inhibitor of apoptosis 1-like [Penaeus vannamei]
MHRQRMESFMNWPRDKKIPKAVDLAEAGFLRPAKTLELHDLVQCFQCGISLEKWTEDDIPWNQHALWNPYCSYLRMVKGEEFIMEVHNMNYTRMSTISDSTLNQYEREIFQADMQGMNKIITHMVTKRLQPV